MHDVYLRYKDQGFEYISVSLAILQDNNKVKNILAQQKTTNLTIIAPELRGRYSFGAGSQKILLDRSGKMIAMNDQIEREQLIPTIEKALKHN